MAQSAPIRTAPEPGPRMSALQRLLAPVPTPEPETAVVPLFPGAALIAGPAGPAPVAFVTEMVESEAFEIQEFEPQAREPDAFEPDGLEPEALAPADPGPEPEDRASDPAPAQASELETDWPAAIGMMRGVAARVRQARAEAEEAGRRAEARAEASARRAEEAEARLARAETGLRAAAERAERAEALARTAEARAVRAEAETQAARAAQREAQVWLRRLYASVLTEFDGLTEDPPTRLA